MGDSFPICFRLLPELNAPSRSGTKYDHFCRVPTRTLTIRGVYFPFPSFLPSFLSPYSIFLFPSFSLCLILFFFPSSILSLLLYQVFSRTRAGVAFGHQAALSHRLGQTPNFPTGFQVLVFKCQVNLQIWGTLPGHEQRRSLRPPAKELSRGTSSPSGGRGRVPRRVLRDRGGEEPGSAVGPRPPRPAAPPLGGSPRLFWRGLFA